MNALTIAILVIVIFICLYYTIEYVFPDVIIGKLSPLNPIQTFGPSTLDNPNSVRYYYEAWLYIDANTPPDKYNVIFNRGTNFMLTLKGSNLSVFSSDNGASGISYSASGQLTPPQTGFTDASCVITIMPDFPFQKWTHLVIAVDGANMDVYIDGKFVKSTDKFTNVPGTSGLTVGNAYTQGKITRFRRITAPINPQGVWANYMQGNGQGMSLTPYHLNVQVLKDNRTQNDIRLF